MQISAYVKYACVHMYIAYTLRYRLVVRETGGGMTMAPIMSRRPELETSINALFLVADQGQRCYNASH